MNHSLLRVSQLLLIDIRDVTGNRELAKQVTIKAPAICWCTVDLETSACRVSRLLISCL